MDGFSAADYMADAAHKAALAAARAEGERSELTARIDGVRTELTAKIEEVRQELHTETGKLWQEMAAMRRDINRVETRSDQILQAVQNLTGQLRQAGVIK